MSDLLLEDVDIAQPKSKRTISMIPKKVYLVDVDNGESYSDHKHWISKVFTTYRGASQWLINEGYKVCLDYKITDEGKEYEIYFYWQESSEYMSDCSFANIIEMDLEEIK